MAILVDFRKVREDQQEVEYLFGYPEMNRGLVIRKDTTEGRPTQGSPDRDFTAVLVTIVRAYRSRETWPNQGSYAA
jgi:hypothetical protein